MPETESVFDLVPTCSRSASTIFIGESPTTRTRKLRNGTFSRLQRWCEEVDCSSWDFWNVVQVPNSREATREDIEELRRRVEGKSRVVALGCWVSSILKKNGIEHMKIDHPSPRNRNFNDPTYEGRMLTVLREYLSR